MTVRYTDGTERDIIPGKDPIDLPGKTRDPNIYSMVKGQVRNVGIIKGERIYQLALAYVPADDDLKDLGRGWYDTPFMTLTKDKEWKGPVRAKIPRTIMDDKEHIEGWLATIRPRTAIKRNEVAVKILERSTASQGSSILRIQKEKFDITHGFITGIIRSSSGVKIRGAMPIGPKPGNKYAALYAQKNVCAAVLPMNKIPIARWTNPITNEEEEIIPDIIFNPLSFPSRMTMGMNIEILIAGTISYLFSLSYGERTYKDIFDNDSDMFD
jgi:DNA-directed RNA polymerase beta subunit